MTTTKFKVTFFTIIGLCTLIIIISFTKFDFIEVDMAANWTMKYFALPILIAMIPICWYTYFRFIREHETKEYDSIMWTRARSTFRIFILTLAMTGIFIATTLSLIILTNSIGESTTLELNAKIIDYRFQKNKGRTRHYIKIQDDRLDRIVELKVDEPYSVGETFNKTMKIGVWGLLYSEK